MTKWIGAPALAASLALAGCAAQHETVSRGWIGGEFRDVSRDGSGWIRHGRSATVVGMPAGVDGGSAALVAATHDGDPLSRAGLVPGDLVLSLDGKPVEDALDLRDRIESAAPGSHAQVLFWRHGATRTADLVVGRETYRPAGRVTLGLGISSALDIWPFDDGIDLLGLVRLRWDDERHEVSGPVADYLREVRPGEPVEGPLQEATDVFLLVVGAAKGKTVVSQETLP